VFERIWHMLVKEFIQTFRDPRGRALVFVIPAFQVLVIGYAVTYDVRNVATAVYDQDNSVVSRDLTSQFVNSGYFHVVAAIDDDRQLRRVIDHGEATVVLHFRHGFAADLRAGRTAQVQMVLDGTDSNTAAVIMGYASKIAAAYSRQVMVEHYQAQLGAVRQPPRLDLRTRAWFNENLESRNYFVPGVIVIVVTLITLLVTALSVVREREIGTMEQIMVSPITPTEFILGKTLPAALIGLVDVLLVTLVGVFWFQVPMRGSVALLFGCSCLYLLTTLGVGLLISTISQTQQQAMMSTFFFFFPAMMLSGFVFPIPNMPDVVQYLTLINPMRYYLVIIRALFLKGVGVSILWPQMVPLAAMGIIVLTAATLRMRKTLG
jgi:ABC-2 type transport system permease protein